MTEVKPSNLLIMVAAGGTGGHLFPAEALSAALSRRGIATALATDNRAAKYADYFASMHVVPSATWRGRDPISIARTGFTLAMGLGKAMMMMRSVKPSAVVGFGGYPSVPTVLAASLSGIPTLLHEQNAVMGRANRFLASRVTAIATGFAGVTDNDKALAIKTTCIGNPLRPAVIEAAKIPYVPVEPNGPLKLLVFGGSQGASIMADIVPAAIAKLEPHLQMRLKITQQTREEDIPRVREIYARAQVSVEIAPFYNDLPTRIAASHLVVSRSGAGTVAELSAIGRPAILVPLPNALDQDQAANALVLEKAGGAIRLLQRDFTPDRLAVEIDALAADSARLTAMADGARSIGVLDAAERLADLVLRIAGVSDAPLTSFQIETEKLLVPILAKYRPEELRRAVTSRPGESFVKLEVLPLQLTAFIYPDGAEISGKNMDKRFEIYDYSSLTDLQEAFLRVARQSF